LKNSESWESKKLGFEKFVFAFELISSSNSEKFLDKFSLLIKLGLGWDSDLNAGSKAVKVKGTFSSSF